MSKKLKEASSLSPTKAPAAKPAPVVESKAAPKNSDSLSYIRKVSNNSEFRMLRQKMEYYKNIGGYIRIPKTKRLDWNVVNEIDSALNPKKGKKRTFDYDSENFNGRRDSASEDQPSTSVTVPDSASSGSDALKIDIDGNINPKKKGNILYRIMDRNKSYENINRNVIMDNYNRNTNNYDINGSSPRKFGHRIKKHVFDDIVRNEEDSLTELLKNNPFEPQNLTKDLNRIVYKEEVPKISPERVEFGVQTNTRTIEIPSKAPPLIKRKEGESNNKSNDLIKLNSKLAIDPKENYYGSYLTERTNVYLPNIKNNNTINPEKRNINMTFDNTNKSLSRLEVNDSLIPSLNNKINLDKRIRDLSYTPVSNAKTKAADLQASKINYLNYNAFKQFLDKKESTKLKKAMPFDIIDKQLNLQVKQSLNNGFNPISNTYNRNLSNSIGY